MVSSERELADLLLINRHSPPIKLLMRLLIVSSYFFVCSYNKNYVVIRKPLPECTRQPLKVLKISHCLAPKFLFTGADRRTIHTLNKKQAAKKQQTIYGHFKNGKIF